jgi:hypothetical protein
MSQMINHTTAPTYLIASPSLRTGARRRWHRLRAELAALLSDTALVCWPDLPRPFRNVPREDRPARLAVALAAAVVVPDKVHDRRWIGRTALAEVRAFTAAGKPVAVYAAGELVAWDACKVVRNADGAPEFTPVEIVVPPKPIDRIRSPK